MAYMKNTWVDQDVERPKTYEVTNNEDGSITLTDSFGLVTELGTPVNEVNMNHIEDGIDGCAIRKHNLTETFNLDEWVLGGTGDDEGIYKSLVSNNVGNAITDDTKWEKVEMGGNTRNIGEVVVSTMPLTDAGLHLLDGALISGSGSYSAFVDYIADLYNSGDYTAIFTTEATWQSTVTASGICSQYVYDSVNNTVRLPKWGGKVVTKENVLNVASTVPVRGNGKALGLTDGSTKVGLENYTNVSYGTMRLGSTSSYGESVGFAPTNNVTMSSPKAIGVTTDAVESGLIANTGGNITLAQYTMNVYYYVVIATSTKTDIEVDIDEIATDLNGKADADLTNVTADSKTIDGSWVDSSIVIASGANLPTTADASYSLSSYLPSDNYKYEVLLTGNVATAAAANSFAALNITSDIITNSIELVRLNSRTITAGVLGSGNIIIPVGTGRTIKVLYSSAYSGATFNLKAVGYRRIGTN